MTVPKVQYAILRNGAGLFREALFVHGISPKHIKVLVADKAWNRLCQALPSESLPIPKGNRFAVGDILFVRDSAQ